MITRREERLLRTLRQRRTREAEGLFLVEGIRAVEDLAASPLPIRFAAAVSSLGDTPRGQALLHLLASQRVVVHELADRDLAALAETETPQGILAVAAIPRAGLDALRVEDADPAVLLVLDAVQDPGNFGTLARTAEALGSIGLVALPGTVDPWNPKSVRAAMGSTFRLPVVEAGWEELAPWLGERGVETLAAVVGGEPLGERPRRAALVLGNEGAGVGDDTRARADRAVGIPLRGRAESLNVAAAGAILLYELLR